MNKSNVTQMFNTAKSFVTKHSPEILTGVGIAGMISTTVLAVKATPKALELIEEAETRKFADLHGEYHDLGKEPLTAIETVKAAWKPYVPAAITCALSTTCLIGASATNYKRNAALATAYQVAATTLADYKEQVVESIGEKKEKTIREKVAQKQVDRNPVTKSEIIITGAGDVLFLEPVSMRYFTFDIERMRKVFNDLNYRMVTGMEPYISLSEFYDEVGLSHTSNSDNIGWSLYGGGQIEVDYYATTADDGRPCLKLDYLVAPRYEFDKLT